MPRGKSKFRPATKHDLTETTRLLSYIQQLESYVTEVGQQVDDLRVTSGGAGGGSGPQLTDSQLQQIRQALSARGAKPLDLTALRGQLGESQRAKIPRYATRPDPLTTIDDTVIVTGSGLIPDIIYTLNREVNPPSWSASSVTSAHDLLSATHTDSLAAVVSRGSLIVGNATPKWSELVLGGALTLLRVNAGGTDLEYGGVADSQLSTNVPLKNAANVFSAGQQITSGGIDVQGPTRIRDTWRIDGTAVGPGISPYTVLATDVMIYANTGSGAVTVVLPATPSNDTVVVVIDVAGNATTNNITVDGNGANINAAATYTMNTNYRAVWLIFSGSVWNIFASFT